MEHVACSPCLVDPCAQHLRLALCLVELASLREVAPDFTGMPVAVRTCERAVRLITQSEQQGFVQQCYLRGGAPVRLASSVELDGLQKRVLQTLSAALSGRHLAEFERMTRVVTSRLSGLPTASACAPSSACALSSAYALSAAGPPPCVPPPPTAIGVPVGRMLLDMSEHVAARFVPAIVLLQVWVYCLVWREHGRLSLHVAAEHWPMSLAMCSTRNPLPLDLSTRAISPKEAGAFGMTQSA